jgi:hypothetical protein
MVSPAFTEKEREIKVHTIKQRSMNLFIQQFNDSIQINFRREVNDDFTIAIGRFFNFNP